MPVLDIVFSYITTTLADSVVSYSKDNIIFMYATVIVKYRTSHFDEMKCYSTYAVHLLVFAYHYSLSG